MHIQEFIVIIIVTAAVAYAAYRVYKALTSKGGRCYGCPLIDVCKKNKCQRPKSVRNKGVAG